MKLKICTGAGHSGPEPLSRVLQPSPTGSGELIIKLQQIWEPVDLTVGSLQSATVGVFTPLRSANATTQGFPRPQNQLLNIYHYITTAAYRQQ